MMRIVHLAGPRTGRWWAVLKRIIGSAGTAAGLWMLWELLDVLDWNTPIAFFFGVLLGKFL